ncbi:MAG: serine hydrolase [Pseudomonadota bacterium]|nr:serine hydrolase [Pseudomonadota bacterium]
MIELPPLPAQPATTPWPTGSWPSADLPAAVDAAALHGLVRTLIDLPPEHGVTDAVLVVHRGALVLEAYGPEANAQRTLQSWSMAKSMLHALVGVLVLDGRIDPEARLPAPEWQADGDPRARISWRDALRMRSGLAFAEDYANAGASDVIEMLWGAGKDDVARYAADKPLEHAIGSVFNYSSGTTNILSRAIGELIGGGEAGMRAFMTERLFSPLGMLSPLPKFDSRGTWKGSSFCFCTAQDFARFALLYLRDGLWDGERLLPPGWADDARTPTHLEPDAAYGSHWWVDHRDPTRFFASGYEGQRILIDPARDLIAMRFGRTPNERAPEVMEPLHAIPALFTRA